VIFTKNKTLQEVPKMTISNPAQKSLSVTFDKVDANNVSWECQCCGNINYLDIEFLKKDDCDMDAKCDKCEVWHEVTEKTHKVPRTYRELKELHLEEIIENGAHNISYIIEMLKAYDWTKNDPIEDENKFLKMIHLLHGMNI
jgi:hypothetical protein